MAKKYVQMQLYKNDELGNQNLLYPISRSKDVKLSATKTLKDFVADYDAKFGATLSKALNSDQVTTSLAITTSGWIADARALKTLANRLDAVETALENNLNVKVDTANSTSTALYLTGVTLNF